MIAPNAQQAACVCVHCAQGQTGEHGVRILIAAESGI